MSVRVMSWVWEHSRSKSSQRLVLLAIADCAADHGGNAYPSMATLVSKTGLSTRTVQDCLRKLVELKELSIAPNAGPRGCNRYRIHMTTPAESAPPQDSHPADPAPAKSAPPAESAPPPPQNLRGTPADLAPGTVIEPSVEPSEISPPPSASLAIVERPDVERICNYLAEWIVKNGARRPTISKRWRTEARLLIDKDGKTLDEIREVIAWSQRDSFWRSNILSMPKLREKYDQLWLAAQRGNRTNPTNGQDIDWNAAMERAKAREGITA